MTGSNTNAQHFDLNRSTGEGEKCVAGVDEQSISSHLQKIQDLEKLRDIIDGELERARNDAMMTVQKLLTAANAGDDRRPAVSPPPTNSPGSATADAAAVARFLDILGRGK